MHFHWSRAGSTLEAVMCTTVERWPKTVHTIASGLFCTERRKQQARWVACGGNTPPLLPLKRQPGVVVMRISTTGYVFGRALIAQRQAQRASIANLGSII
jgi:hypothetical protein